MEIVFLFRKDIDLFRTIWQILHIARRQTTLIDIDVPQSRDGIRIVLPDRNSGPEISNFKILSDKCQDHVHAEDCKKIVIV